MKEYSLRDLRKKKNMSQQDLAEKLFVSIATISKWERNKVIPSMQEIDSLAKVLDVKTTDVIKIFRTENTRVRERELKEKKTHEEFTELFWGADNIRKFIIFSSIMSDMDMNGVIYYENYLFPFAKIISNYYGNGVIVADNFNNLIVFTNKNVKSVKPISVYYDVYTFEIESICPMFPLDEKQYSSSSNNFKAKISIYCR